MVAHPRIENPDESAHGGIAIAILLAASLMMASGACSATRGVVRPPVGLDLADRFTRVGSSEQRVEADKQFVRHEQVVRHGLARDAMVLIAPVTIRASLGDISGRAVLEGLSTPIYNVGDGMQMEIILLGQGRERVVYSRYYDAGRRIEDRAWIPFHVPLDLEEWPRDPQLEIRLSAGPQGDLVADWLALSALRIVQGDPVR